jgi:hypothetical protein
LKMSPSLPNRGSRGFGPPGVCRQAQGIVRIKGPSTFPYEREDMSPPDHPRRGTRIMKTMSWSGCRLAAFGLGLAVLAGCQTYIPEASWTGPSGRYLEHPPQYIPPSPPFPLGRELSSMEAAVAAGLAGGAPGAAVPLPPPVPLAPPALPPGAPPIPLPPPGP